MTDKTLTDLKDTARKILSYNRMQLLNKHPFIGNIGMNLDLVPIRDARCSTAMTDGNTIYFDIDFLSRLTEDEIQFVIGHEIWHVVMVHFLRGEGKNHENFNIAADMEVNQILEKDGFIAPKDALFPNNNRNNDFTFNFPNDLSAEEYYDLLENWKAAQKKSNDSQFENEGTDGQSQDGQNSKGKKQKKQNKEKCKGQFDKHFDQNEDQEEALKEAMEQGAEDKYGKKEADEDYQPRTISNESQKREATERVREMVISSAQTYERSRGELPGHVKKIVDALLESKMPWKELLSAFITKGFENRTCWNVPNRRFAYKNIYLPSHDGEKMKIAIGIDMSGSCQNDCEKFLSEVNAIAKSFDSYELHLIGCDTEVKTYEKYDEYNPLDPKENPITFNGFGGTHLHPIFDYISLNELDVDAAVIFTDGICENFEDDGNIDLPIMWMITGNHHCKNLQIGEKVKLEA